MNDGPDVGTTTAEVEESARSMWDTFLEALPRVGLAIGVVVVGWVLSRGIRWGLRRLWARRQTPSFAEVMSKVVGWVFLAGVVLLAVAVTFPSVRPVDVLAGLGFFSVAIGFAFQDILENTLSGVLLLFRQPFRSGDQIEVEGRSGTVEAITIRETRIRTFDGQLVIIPNRDVYKSAIRVQTAFAERRIEFSIGVDIDSDLEVVARQVVQAVEAVPAVSAVPPPTAFVSGVDARVADLRVWFWTGSRQHDAIETTHQVMVAVVRRLEAAGIELPVDTLAVMGTESLAAALHPEVDDPGRSATGG